MTLIELRDALAKATGPTREINSDIAVMICGYTLTNVLGPQWQAPWENFPRSEPPNFSGSIDAAVTLEVEGWHSRIDQGGHVEWVSQGDYRTAQTIVADAATRPLALCLARVKYEIAKGKS